MDTMTYEICAYEICVYEICVYDDGNEKYKHYENEWLVVDRWRGKYSLVNKVNDTIKINSISMWKVIKK